MTLIETEFPILSNQNPNISRALPCLNRCTDDYTPTKKSDNTNDGSNCCIVSAAASNLASVCSNASSYSIVSEAQATAKRGSGPDLRSSATIYDRWRKQHHQRTATEADREPPKRLASFLRRIEHLNIRLFQCELIKMFCRIVWRSRESTWGERGGSR